MNKSTLIIAPLTLALTLLLGLGIGYWLFSGSQTLQEDARAEAQPLFYRNPMNPSITSPVPAQDSMGMDYIPVYADDAQAKIAGTVTINPAVEQNIGVRKITAVSAALSRTIRTVGRVGFDEQGMALIHPKVEGWIEEIRVDKTGQSVAKGDILLSIYSPKLVATQQEYLLALDNLAALEKSPIEEIRIGAQDLVKSTLQRLRLLDVPEHQIKELEQSRKIKKNLHIHSPAAGVAVRIGARLGEHVTPRTELYRIVDLSHVWVYADIYDYELPWVKTGDQVEMTLASVPGKTFVGAVEYIFPYAEAKTRTTKVRILFDNLEQLLRPEMFSQISISSDIQQNAIVIPAEAVIRSGARTQVFVVRGPGKFEPRMVELGIESKGLVSILKGLEAGEEVVTSAQFLVDSESKLREATAKMMSAVKTVESEFDPTVDQDAMPEGMPKQMPEQMRESTEHIHHDHSDESMNGEQADD